jgi:hypothetical protein
MIGNQPTRWFLSCVLVGVGVLAPPVTGHAESTTDYVNTWYPRGTNQTSWTPIGTSFYGGSDFKSSGSHSAPAQGNLRITGSRFGMACGAIEANYHLGQALPAPLGANTNLKPVLNSNDLSRVVWIDYAQRLYAIDQGAVTVQWNMWGGGLNPVTYVISDSPAGRPVYLYWTEAPYAAPTVILPKGPILPTIHFNNQIVDTNMVWLDSGNALHAAKDVRGKFLLTYSSKDSKGIEKLQGAEIVQVLEPLVTVQTVAIGQRLLPANPGANGTSNLSVKVVRGLLDPSTQDPKSQFVFQQAQGPQNGWLYSVRKTEAPWQIEVYWLAKSLLDVVWPFEADHYSADWPANAQLYARGAPSSGNLGPSVQFPTALSVELMSFQEPEGHAVLQDNSLNTTAAGHCLLKYVDEDEVAFEVVQSVYSNDADHFDLQDWTWDIGRELRPELPKNHSALDFSGGYVSVSAAARFATNVKNAAALTIEAWVCLRGLQDGKMVPIVAKGTNGYNLMVTNGTLAYVNPGLAANHLSVATRRLSTNRWTHVAVVVQAGETGDVQFYIDGLPAGQDTFEGTSVFSNDDPADPLRIGWNGSSSPSVTFAGGIDEVRIWSAALPGRYVNEWMNRVLTSAHPSYPRLVAEFRFEEQVGSATVGYGPSGVSWSGSLAGNLTWETSGAHLEEDPNLTTPYAEWPGYIQSFTGDRYNVNLYQYPPNATSTPPPSQIFAVNPGRLEVWWANQTRCGLDLPIYWPSLVNLYTNRWPAEPQQMVIASELGSQSATVQYGSAACLWFDGVDDYLQVPDNPSLEFSDNFTLECWVKPASKATGLLPLLSKGLNEYAFAINAGWLQFQDNTSGATYSSTNQVPLGRLSHVAVTYSAGLRGLRFYINGQPAGQSDLPLGHLATGSGNLWIGGSLATSAKYSGLMDEVRLWGRVLTPSEITRNMYAPANREDADLRAAYTFDSGDFADGVATDSSGYANHAFIPSSNGTPLESIPGIPRLQPGQSFAQQHPRVYYQNDPALPGYNPNEEHALVVGDQVYALRDDFNTTNDPPYVLVQYTPPDISPRQAMAVFRVVQTNELYAFKKGIIAGTRIQAPLPLSMLVPANCRENYAVNDVYKAAWTDRQGYLWARNAADDGTNTASFTMKFFYPVQQGFAFPGLSTPPPVGTHIPWLSGRNINQAPVDYLYTVSWPETPPLLNVVSTLIEARDGLPAIRGQKSVDILYQQSVAQTSNPTNKSVELIDPTVMRTARLDKIAPAIKSYIDPTTGFTYFTELPTDLRDRLYWNPTAPKGQELQLVGNYKEMTDSQYNYLRLNVLSNSNRVAALSLPQADNAWTTAINGLPSDPVILTNDTVPFDSIALSAGIGKGRGYVTLVFNNSKNPGMVQESDVIEVAIIRVDQPMYSGMLDQILSANPLDQKQSLRYTADFAGKPNLYEFEWQYAAGSNPDAWNDYGPTTPGLDSITIGDAGIFGLSDHWIRCRYRALDPAVQQATGTDWSPWTPSALAEGWIKRVMTSITPYEQRIKDFQQGLLTTLDMVTQAGPPYAGDVPLNLEALNQNGLIQIYQTVLEKGKKLSIDAGYNDQGANQALLLAAGRLSDLYTLLGNEAYADALDPTIGLGTSDPVWGSAAPSIFCFMNQMPTLLDEELALLRGRDDSQSPSTDTYPVYNRLLWNFTSDITGGEVAYALNYDIRDANGNLDGFINAADAQALYPQGHGDAWGQYLSATKGYYDLLHNTNFVWIPQSEQVNVGSEPVGVSYLHEQRFCQSAAAKARVGALIVGDTYRSLYAGEGLDTWQVMRDSNTNRCWGVAEWASRAGMGAYFDWLVGNALLPNHDPYPDHSGISLIDRQTVPELAEISSQYLLVQEQVDHADGGMNPLGLANGVVPFDISPADADSGQTHFDQIYTRALDAWRNALSVFDNVRFNAQALRNQAESQETFNLTVAEAEIDFTNRLVELYGYPYADDIGSGKPYPQNYQGPDLLHYNYIDLQDITGLANMGQTITLTLTNTTVEPAEGEVPSLTLSNQTQSVQFYIGAQGLPSVPSDFSGHRRSEGRIQIALKEFVRSLSEMRRSLSEFHQLNDELQARFDMLQNKSRTFTKIGSTLSAEEEAAHDRNMGIQALKALASAADNAAEDAAKYGDALSEATPNSSLDWFSIAHGVGKIGGATFYTILTGVAWGLEIGVSNLEVQNEEAEKATENEIVNLEHNLEIEDDLAELRILANSQQGKYLEVQSLIAAVDSARMEYSSVLAEGQRLQVARQTFRRHTAGTLQANRYRNMAFRIFRNDALQRYQAAFDLAARYVYLAAKAYDYETALPIATSATFSGRNLMAQIARARSLGRCSIVNETFDLPEPLAGGPTGDPGLADVLARLQANWGVLKGRYGFNNPDSETGRFSLRAELFRIPPGPEGDADWRATLEGHYVANLLALPEFKRYCLPFEPAGATEPALVIPFRSTVQFGKNFFGLDLAAGDNAYDSSHFATKIRSVGIWFTNFNNAFNVSADQGGGLANMPRVYLIPIGLDVTRVPAGDQSSLRTWVVMDQALPVPYAMTQEDLVNPNWIPLQDSLDGGFGNLRKFPAMRAYHDAGFDVSEMTYSSRLIGRSVWNTQWLLIIPGRTLLSDGAKGIQRFIHGAETAPGKWDENGVKDVRIFFQTYSYSGN